MFKFTLKAIQHELRYFLTLHTVSIHHAERTTIAALHIHQFSVLIGFGGVAIKTSLSMTAH